MSSSFKLEQFCCPFLALSIARADTSVGLNFINKLKFNWFFKNWKQKITHRLSVHIFSDYKITPLSTQRKDGSTCSKSALYFSWCPGRICSIILWALNTLILNIQQLCQNSVSGFQACGRQEENAWEWVAIQVYFHKSLSTNHYSL